MTLHSSTSAWKIPWTEEPGRLQSMGSLGVGHTERLHFHFSLSCSGGGNGNPLQYSYLESPREGESWWAAVYGVAQSRTWLKQLSSSSSSSSINTKSFFLLRKISKTSDTKFLYRIRINSFKYKNIFLNYQFGLLWFIDSLFPLFFLSSHTQI